MAEQTRVPRRYLLITVGVVVALLVLVILVRLVLADSETEGVRLSARTMVPTTVNPAGDADCPTEPGASPYEFEPDGALAEQIAVYEGEIIAVRINVAPFGGPLPEQVRFDAAWTSDAVVDSPPLCAFVVADDGGPASTLQWTTTDAAAVRFDVRTALRYAPTVIEVWLEAADPVEATAISTSITTELQGDQYVVDPLGGRKAVERRPGVAAQVELETDDAEIVDDTVALRAVVENPTMKDWVFDAELEVTVDVPGLGWTTTDVPPELTCTGGGTVTCDLGDLAPGERSEVGIAANVPDESVLTALQCLNEIHRAGVCVEAELTSATGDLRSSTSSSLFFSQSPRSTGALQITSDPPIVSRRPDETPEVRILVRGPGDGDVSAVEVIASDCVEIARGRSDLEDGDAFLEVDEAWAFNCLLDPELTGDFRVDFGATGPTGGRITGRYVSSVEVVDPTVSIGSANETDRGVEFTLTNTGVGDVFEVTVRIPGCESQFFDPPLPGPIGQGQSVIVVCERGDVDPSGIVVFGTDASGSPFVNRPAAG